MITVETHFLSVTPNIAVQNQEPPLNQPVKSVLATPCHRAIHAQIEDGSPEQRVGLIEGLVQDSSPARRYRKKKGGISSFQVFDHNEHGLSDIR